MALIPISAPAVEPVTVADLKLQCGLPPDDDSDHVKSYQVNTRFRKAIRVARRVCENYTRRAFITQTWQMVFDQWPFVDSRYMHRPDQYGSLGPWGKLAFFYVPKPPLQSITTFTYTDTGGVTQTVSSWGQYQLDPGGETAPARLCAPVYMLWPPLYPALNAVQLEFIAGYGDAGANVPDEITDAILLQAQYIYDGYRLEKDPPADVRRNLDPYRNLVA